MLTKNVKYIALFLDKIQTTYRIVKKKRFYPSNENISYKNNTYLIDKTVSGYSKKNNKIFFFFDIITGQLSFHKVKSIDPKLAHLVLTSGIISSITNGLTKKSSFNFTQLIPFIIGIALGFFIGFTF
jgi:hypothetical protein